MAYILYNWSMGECWGGNVRIPHAMCVSSDSISYGSIFYLAARRKQQDRSPLRFRAGALWTSSAEGWIRCKWFRLSVVMLFEPNVSHIKLRHWKSLCSTAHCQLYIATPSASPKPE